MTPEMVLLIAILIIPLGFVLVNKLRMDLAALLMAVLLGMSQFAGLGMLGTAHTSQDAVKAIAGFSQPVVITLISLFVLTRGLEEGGATRWIARQIIRLGGHNPGRLIALFAAATAFLSLFMNNLAAGALVLPSAMETARRTGIKPSKFLIPVAYGSLLGGSATYFTTANIIMSDLLRIASPPQPSLGFLDFFPTGGLIAIAGVIFLWVFGDRILPEREPSIEQAVTRRSGREIEDLYQVGDRLWLGRVKPGSVLVGHTISESEIGKRWGIAIAAIQRGVDTLPVTTPALRLQLSDQLLMVGREEKARQLTTLGLELQPVDSLLSLSMHGLNLAELVLAPHSTWEGMTLKTLDFRQRFGLTAIALKRSNRSYRTDIGDIPVNMGDSLLVLGLNNRIQRLSRNPDVIVIEPQPGEEPVNVRKAVLTAGITAAAIAASIAGVPVYLSVLTGAVLLLLLKVVTLEDAYRSIEWQAVFLIAGMYAVSLAMVQTGLASGLGQAVLGLVAPLGALGLAGGAYLLTGLLTQFMGGQVSALVTGPVMISAALSMGINPQAVAVATAIGCSASFFTPMAHPVNVLMMAPANYRFRDFFRAGWPLTILSFLMLLAGLVLFWQLR